MTDPAAPDAAPVAEFFVPGATYLHRPDAGAAPGQAPMFVCEYVTVHRRFGAGLRAFGFRRTNGPGAPWYSAVLGASDFPRWVPLAPAAPCPAVPALVWLATRDTDPGATPCADEKTARTYAETLWTEDEPTPQESLHWTEDGCLLDKTIEGTDRQDTGWQVSPARVLTLPEVQTAAF